MLRFSFMLCLLSIASFSFLTGRTIDANQGLTYSQPSMLPVHAHEHAKQLHIEDVWSEITFVESGSTVEIQNFPISLTDKATVKLQLIPSVVDGTTEVYVGNERIPAPIVRTFSGKILNEPGSFVLLSYSNGDIRGWVERADGSRLNISPESNDQQLNKHLIFDQELASELKTESGTCMTDESAITIPTPEDLYASLRKSDYVKSNNLLELQVVVEATTAFFNGPGRKDSIKTAEFMIGLMNGVNTLYRRELNVNIIIPRLQIWTSASQDPYANDGNGNAPGLLDEVEARWSKISTVKRDIVHCVDAVGSTGGLFVLGIANGIGNVCSGSLSNAYSVAGVFKNGLSQIDDYVSDIVTIAHEIGHNIGSYHTHNCQFWPPRGLDSCMTSGTAYRGRSNYSTEACFKSAPMTNPGSVMSYCHLTNPSRSVAFTFLPRVSNYLRTYLESRSCIEAATQPTIRMIAPWGQRSFVVGTQTPIEWTSNRVSNVNIEFSTDGGISWRAIFVSRPAVTEANGTGKFNWTIPDNPTTKGRIRIVDGVNDQVRDTSWADFTIAKASLTLSTDLRSKKIGQKERVALAWTKSLVDRVRIEFSSDNGVNWNLLNDSLANTTFTIDIPDIVSSACFVRILDVSTKKIISQTGPFEVGREKISLITPANNDTLCKGKQHLVTWNSEFMSFSKINLEYREVKETVWKRIVTLGHDAILGTYSWNISSLPEGMYVFRSTYRLDTSVSTTPIMIAISSQGSCASIAGIVDGTSAFEIFPNPTKEILTIRNTQKTCQNSSIIITNAEGKIVSELQLQSLDSDTDTHISLKHLSAGQYFCTMQCGNTVFTQPFSIIR